MEEHNSESFTYTYSAKQQEEVKYIRDKYLPKEEDKMEQLRRLDRSVTKKGTVTALVIGIIGALIMGIGMSLIMTDIGSYIGMEQTMIPGIVIGVIGMAIAAPAYPVYERITKKERAKIAPEIMRLTEELMK
ncbi:MAG: hypothetical protein IJ306_08970 [Oscillospiraceae bacterium]|nr:hypothetical protein [Oscillospiraceae bacterium]